jgi:putative transposase
MALFHVWFSTKKRKAVLAGEVRDLVLGKLRKLALASGVALVESEAQVDHVHLLLRLEDPTSLPDVMHLLKGATSRQITLKHRELRAEMGKSFWQKSYGARPIQEHELEIVRKYIRTQSERPVRHHS